MVPTSIDGSPPVLLPQLLHDRVNDNAPKGFDVVITKGRVLVPSPRPLCEGAHAPTQLSLLQSSVSHQYISCASLPRLLSRLINPAADTSSKFSVVRGCAGLFLQNRTKANIWAYEGCVFNCAAHYIFNLDFPELGLGRLDFGTASVTATFGQANFTYAYLGPRFGCQLQAGKVPHSALPLPFPLLNGFG